MTNPDIRDPGHASPKELHAYWRTKSVRATEERARRLGIRKTGRGYPWLLIWRAEGLAPPPERQWAELKLPHKTMNDIAEILGRSVRTARRRRHHKPDAEFPDPIAFGPNTQLWRAAQIDAWEKGRPVPVYNTYVRSSQRRLEEIAEREEAAAPVPDRISTSAVFDPFAETARLSAGTPGFRPQ